LMARKRNQSQAENSQQDITEEITSQRTTS
jgi:hypothetical protein